MNLTNIQPAKGATKTSKRIGRGQGSGKGGTATRGHKGAKSRSGYSKKIGFEGGQMPLQRRIPKYGFKNFNRIAYKGVNLYILQQLADSDKVKDNTIDVETLIQAGIVSKNDLVKILGDGELSVKLTVVAHKFSKTAVKAIENAGGTTQSIIEDSTDKS